MIKIMDNRPIEVLGLDAELIKKLKDVFIYTVGDLQLKTTEALLGIPGFDGYLVGKIENILASKTGRGFSEYIEKEEKLEELELTSQVFRMLKRIGICRVSELMNISESEIKTIEGISKSGIEQIQKKLKLYYGDDYEILKGKIMEGNPDAIGLGHLEVVPGFLVKFRNGGIYTIGDFQRKSDDEITTIDGIFRGSIERISEQLVRLGIGRYKEGEDRIETMKLPQFVRKVLKENEISSITQLGEITLSELKKNIPVREMPIDRILEEYLIAQLLKDEKLRNGITELQILAKIKTVLSQISKNIQLQNQKLKEILDKIRTELETDECNLGDAQELA